jgi:thiamine pyrophosphate-dependent acetolactate synthase large subunit-like protein
MTSTDSHASAASQQAPAGAREGHAGEHAIAAAQAHGVSTLFTLSGAHVFPMYDGAVRAEPPVRLLDVRHESSAVFAAEAMGKLTRTPGLAVLTAGPDVTNGVSPIAQAHFAGSPLVVVESRTPTSRWGSGSLQELDHPPLLEPVTKHASTVHTVEDVGPAIDAAFGTAGLSHRGPVFLDVPMDAFFSRTSTDPPAGGRSGAPAATVAHVADSPGQVSTHAELAASAAGDLTTCLDGVLAALQRRRQRPDWSAWVQHLHGDIGAALDRAFAAGKPYLVNVLTDRTVAYPRATTGV